jgi:hypothetical protein
MSKDSIGVPIANALLQALGQKGDFDPYQGTIGLGKFLWRIQSDAEAVKRAVVQGSNDIAFLARSLSGAGAGEQSIPLGAAVVQAGQDVKAGLMAVASAVLKLRKEHGDARP